MKIDSVPSTWAVRWLNLGIFFTGVGTTLLGCLLPTLILTWHMDDARAGVLFAAQFSGASMGALLVGHDYFRSLVRGYVLLIASALAVAYFAGTLRVLLFLALGLGLGWSMTGTSMLMGRLFGERRGAALSVLNAYWVLGAILCPVGVSLWVKHRPPTHLFIVFASAAFVVLLLILRGGGSLAVNERDQSGTNAGFVPWRSISIFAFIAFSYVGVETSVGGWMMSYIHRLSGESKAWPVIGASCFWIALLCGRAIAPVLLRRVAEADLLTASVLWAFIGVLLLLLNRAPVWAVLSATSAGFALGPIFPLCMSKVLALAHDSPKTKWVFALSGLGGAVMPWITGKISAFTGSLAVGLIVPLFALGIMLFLLLLRSALTART